MSASVIKLVYITRHIRNLRGGSQSILAQASDGLLYVVKFTNNLQGTNLPFNESLGSELYRACGLPVPSWKLLLVTDAFIDQNQDCWMHTPEGRLRPASGFCFGSRYLGGEGIRLVEILPGTSFKRVRNYKDFWLAWLIDICAGHADDRQAIFLEESTGRFDAFFVDHGHLFGGPKGGQQPHFLASRYFDPRIYQSISSRQLLIFRKIAGNIDVDKLWRHSQELPLDWKTTSALKGLNECLGRVSNTAFLRNVLATIVEAQRQYNEREVNHEPNPNFPVLRPRIQATGSEHHLVAYRASRSVCA
jgi:hypothetical protein